MVKLCQLIMHVVGERPGPDVKFNMATFRKECFNCLAGSAFALALLFVQFSGSALLLLTILLVTSVEVSFPYCIGFYLGTASPTVVNLPALAERTELEQSLPEGYFLQIHQTRTSTLSKELWWRACVYVNASTEQPRCKYLVEVSKGTPCTPEDRMECLPASFASPYFGMSMWKYNVDVGQTHLHYFILSDTGNLNYDITNKTNGSLVNIWYNMDQFHCEYQRQLFVPCVCVAAAMVFVILVISPFFWTSVCMCIRKKLARRVTR